MSSYKIHIDEILTRKIIHVDMDCFYVSASIRDKQHFFNKPVTVGHSSKTRGVICSCNYAARRYGVRSAMPLWKALEKCPALILLPVEMEQYRSISQSILQIFKKYTDIIEPLSLDEAYLDVTGSANCNGSATLIANAIRDDIFQQERITASAGISFNKFLAKIASDWNKPNGQFVIKPQDRDQFISMLPINKVHGVGRVMTKKLNDIGIRSCIDLQALDIKYLIDKLGKHGRDLYYLSRGIDNRMVQVSRPIKSVSVEETFETYVKTLEECKVKLSSLYNKLQLRLSRNPNNPVSTSFVKLKFTDFTRTTIERKFSACELSHFITLIDQALKSKSFEIRLIGIGVRFFENIQSNQYEFEL